MATAAPHSTKKKTPPGGKPNGEFDPDEFRMSIGEHLEELRTRMILGLMGLAIPLVFFFIPPIGEGMVAVFCRPLMNALYANHQNPQVYALQASESFMVFVKVSMISAAAIASPWMLYQLWQFVAAGMFPHERKYVTKYLPLSITLLVSGMLFLYYVVLPLMLRFFLAFNIGIPVTFPATPVDPASSQTPAVTIPLVKGTPAHVVPGMVWFDADESRLKVAIGTAGDTQIRSIPFGSSELVSPMITLAWYVDMVLEMLLSFGVAFQMPLVVLALVRIGIVDVPTLKGMRRYVWFGISIVSAVIVPDVVGGMIALMIPLALLFELGLWLARDPRDGRGIKGWRRRVAAGLRTKEIRQKIYTYGAAALMIALIIHALSRSKSPAPSHPGVPTTAPATAPAATRPGGV